MPVRCVTYNIQYGIGMDGRYDIARIASEVEGADIIAFQEVARGLAMNRNADVAADLEAALPDYFRVFHFPADTDMGSEVKDGRVISRRFQFGNAVFSRFPILASRGHLLPRTPRAERLNLQRGALEALVATPLGAIRFYSVHLDHVDADERLTQVEALRRIALGYGETGGAVTGTSEMGFPELPDATHFVAMGDFNFEPGSRDYRAMTAQPVVDVTASDPSLSCFDPRGQEPAKRLDYCFADSGLAERIHSARVDGAATGSDHRPVWIRIG